VQLSVANNRQGVIGKSLIASIIHHHYPLFAGFVLVITVLYCYFSGGICCQDHFHVSAFEDHRRF